MRIAGVDEAGRGSAIGPLVIAGVLFKKENLSILQTLGVRDSKLLSSSRREQLFYEIKNIALKSHVIILSPLEIDKVVNAGRKLHKLNRLEAQIMAKVIEVLRPEVAYVDAADVLADRFKEHIAENIPFKVKIISEHKADIKYPIVSAASIIAKVERDKAVSELQEKYGNLGSGYPADQKTIDFLKKWINRYETYPDFVRKSWKTAKRLKNEADTKQTKLT
ncbi:ribonuclease HII [Candidatus Bathyarchaeota archaeon]|nr:ribonuclease HII [Candidatus Bathyarchaeota archaeon]